MEATFGIITRQGGILKGTALAALTLVVCLTKE
jgi:hypothetical protein